MENITLTNPEVTPQITTLNYHIVNLVFDWEQSFIAIRIRGDNGESKTFTYGGVNTSQAEQDKAKNFMIALNKMNFSVNSLQKRILQQLVNDGLIAGTVTGVPD